MISEIIIGAAVGAVVGTITQSFTTFVKNEISDYFEKTIYL